MPVSATSRVASEPAVQDGQALSEAAGFNLASHSPRARYTTDTRPRSEAGDSEYVEYTVPGPGDRQIIRLPKTIRMHYELPSESYYIRNVSH
jgi:hypothetical protein